MKRCLQLAARQGIATRCFGTSAVVAAVKARAIVYENNGEPSKIVRGHEWTLPDPTSGQVLLRVGLASINPAGEYILRRELLDADYLDWTDINVLQGVYPAKPAKRSLPGLKEQVFIGGNEGYGVVEEVNGSSSLKKGDWVVFGKPQMGTWSSHMVVDQGDVIKIDRKEAGLTPVMASTLQVNPATAYRMLSDFQQLEKGDVVIQNAANSAVGQAVVQIASNKLGVETINLVRNRPDADMDSLRSAFSAMTSKQAPAHLFTYEDLADRESGAKAKIMDVLAGRRIKLGLNAVCGTDNSNMAKLMGRSATIVTYGAMSKQPFSIPAGLLIFHDFTVKGFMMNQWYASHSGEERQKLMSDLVKWYEEGSLQPPQSKIIEFGEDDSVDEVTRKAREAVQQSTQGFSSAKMFFRFL